MQRAASEVGSCSWTTAHRRPCTDACFWQFPADSSCQVHCWLRCPARGAGSISLAAAMPGTRFRSQLLRPAAGVTVEMPVPDLTPDEVRLLPMYYGLHLAEDVSLPPKFQRFFNTFDWSIPRVLALRSSIMETAAAPKVAPDSPAGPGVCLSRLTCEVGSPQKRAPQDCIHASQMVRTPAQVHPLSTASTHAEWQAGGVGGGVGGDGKHTRSSAFAQHCIHACHLISTPAQVHSLSTAPAQHCIHACQLVSTPAQVSTVSMPAT